MAVLSKMEAYFLQNPRKLLGLDAAGALLTALLNLFVLGLFSDFWGIPAEMPIVLACLAFCFFIYSGSAAAFLKGKFGLALKVIASLNIAYCLGSLSALALLQTSCHALTWLYLGGESLIVLALAMLEMRVGRKLP